MEDFDILQGKIADLTKTADKPGGISLFKDKAKTEYKSTYEILKEISAIYHDLTDKNQAQLLEALAGKRGGQVLAGILNDFGEVEKAMTNMAGAAGSADDEMQIIRESISYQLNALRQTWVGFAQDLLDRGVLQKFVENLTVLSEKFIKLTESNPVVVLSGIGTALLSIRSAFNGTFLKNIKEFIEFFNMAKNGQILNYVKELNTITSEVSEITISDKLDNITQLLSNLGNEVLPEVAEEAVEGAIATETMNVAIEETAVATNTNAVPALVKFKAAIVSALTNPLTWAIAAIGGFIVAVNATKKANEDLRRSAEQLGKEYSSTQKDFQSYKKEISDLHDKLNDSSISYEDAVSVRQRLSEIQDELIDKYGKEKTAILNITNAVEGNISAFDRLSKIQWEETKREFRTQNLSGWDWMNQKVHGADDNIGVMLSEMEDVSKSIRGVQSDYEAFEQAAKQFGGTVDVGDSIGEISLDLASDNAYDLYDKLLKIRGLLEDSNASNKTLQSLDKQISNLKNTIDDYSDFYNQWVLNERILGDSTGQSYEDQWQEWQDAYNEYNQHVIDGNETLAKESKNNLLTQFNELRTELQERVADENDELTEGMATSILDAFRNTLPELQVDFAQADLRAALFIEPQVDETKINEIEDTLTEEPIELPATVVEGIDQIEKSTESVVIGWDKTKESVDSIVPSLESVRNKTEEVEEEVLGVQRESEKILSSNQIAIPKTRLSEEGQRIVDATKAFTDAEELLSLANKNNFNNANGEQQKAYEILQNEADYFGVSIQQILDMLYEAKALDFGFMRGRSDKLANAYGKSRGIDISSDSRKQDYDVITAASDALSDEDYKTALQFTDNTWKQVEETAKNLIRDTDTNEQKAQKYKQIIEEVAGEWRKAKEEAQSVGPSSMSISQTVDSINEKIKPALDSIGDVYTQVLSAPNQLISDSLGKIDLIEQVEKIKSELDSLNELEGIEVDYAPFEHLVEVLQDTSSTGKEVQDAFNGVATSVTNVGIQGTESIKTLVEALSDFGVTNSAEVVVSQMMDNTEALAEAGLDLQQISADLDVTNEEQLQSTYALIDAWGAEVLGASNTAEAMALLKMQVLLLNQNPLDESTSITELIRLAGVAGVATSSLQQLAEIQAKIAALSIELDNAIANNNSGAAAHVIQEIAMLQAKAEQVKTQVTTDVQDAITASYTSPQTTSSAGGAGSDAGKAYVDGFNEELSKLKESYERGELTLGEYLNAYKALIEKYFSDTEKYAEERAKALHDYMQELKGYYDSAISGVTTLIDHRISAVQKQKDAALKAIEDERKAAKAAYEERKKEIEAEIKAKQKEIKALEDAKKPLEDQIKAIQDASAARERDLKLQTDLYNLQKAMSQRTQFIYKNGQMVYTTDTEAEHQARENVRNDKDEVRIAAIQKQIDALDKAIELKQAEIDLLEEESAMIDEELAAIDEFYDKLVEETTAAFDAILEQLENTKSKWEELAEIDKIASAWKDVGGVMEMLGYSVEDVLNDTPGAFEAFKDAYVATLSGLNNGNDQYLQGLSQVTGKTVEELKAMGDGVANISTDVKEPLSDIADSVRDLGTNASTATSGVSNLGSAAGTLKENTQGTDENIRGINDSLSQLDGNALQPLIDKLNEVKNLIGGGESGEGLVGILNGLNENVNLDGVIEQFTNLEAAVQSVVSALGGGGGEENAPLSPNNGPMGSNPTSSSSGGSSGLVSAVEAVKEATDAYIGTGGGEGSGEGSSEGSGEGGGGTAIADFEAMKTAVDDVSTAIGNQESAEDSEDLIGSIKTLGITNTDVLMGGDEGDGVVSEWESFNEQLSEAEEHISGMVEGLENLQDSYETKLTVTLEIEGGGMYTGTATVKGGHARYSFNVLEAIGLPHEGGEWTNLLGRSGKAKLTGTANMSGNWGYEGGRTMIAEIGPELVVYPNGTFETFDHPQLVDLPRGSVIFNHIQTDEILDPNNQIKRKGKANLNGTLPNGLTPLSLADPEQFAQFMQLADALKANTEDMRVDLSDLSTMARDIERSITNTTYNNSNRNANITFGDLNFTCTGITSADVLNEVSNALQQEFNGIALNAYQRAMAH